jgi:beta-galactosidase
MGSPRAYKVDVGGVNTKGLVTFDRKTRKDVFYFYKANWSAEPVTYIASRRYTERAYSVVDTTVYSNADSVTLKVNGNVVAVRSAADCVKRICSFNGVKLQAGQNQVVAEGSHSGRNVTDAVTWNVNPDNATNLYLAAGQMTTGFASADGHRFGSDNFFTGGASANAVLLAIYGGDPKPVTAGPGVSSGDMALYGAYRSSATPFQYELPLANGNYSVTLGFMEPAKTATVGSRVFSVDANGVRVLSNFDILANTGTYRVATTRTFTATVTNGKLNIGFVPGVGSPVISNISARKL